MKRFSLENKAALVTGSSKGIGLAIALGLHEAGAKVVFHGNEERTSEIPSGSSYLKADFLQPEASKQLFHAAVQAQPDLDLLVCNAGSFFDVPFLEMTPQLWEKTMQLNVASSYFLIQEF